MTHALFFFLALVATPSDADGRPEPRRLDIEILYLDATQCTRCVDAGVRLEEALALLGPVMAETGWEARLKKTQVTTEDQALAVRFASSPTVRINGRDIQLDGRESACADCGKLCKDATVTCREWRFDGKWSTSPPRGLFVEAILKAMHASPTAAADSRPIASPFEVPANLKRFFASKTGSASRPGCCASAADSAEDIGCCESRPKSPAKESCCESGQAKAPKTGCTLSAESRVARKGLLTELLRGVEERRDRENGISFRFKPEPGVVSRLAQAVDLERDCCQFLAFRIVVEEKGGAVWLELTGPVAAMRMIDDDFGRK
jgi:hypothetical protein